MHDDKIVIILSGHFQVIFILIRDTETSIHVFSFFGDSIMTVLILIVIGALLLWTFLQDASAPQ